MNLLSAEIGNENLNLRALKMEDKHNISKEFNEDVTTYMYPAPAKCIEDTEDFIETSIALMKKDLEMLFVVEHKDTKEFLGCVGLHNMHKKTPELGIWIKKGAHGNGYGRKAIHMLYEFANENYEFDYFLYPVAKQNIASRKIPESLGGIIKKEEDVITPSGKVLNIVEYHVPIKEQKNNY